MKFKRIICAAIALLTIASVFSITAFATDYAEDFSLIINTEQSTSTPARKKIDNLPAAVTLEEVTNFTGVTAGASYLYVGFRVRTDTGVFATGYDTVSFREGGTATPSTLTLYYYNGMGVCGNDYKLYSQLEEGHYLTGATIKGKWEP